MVLRTQPLTDAATTTIGKMLIEILNGDLTDATLAELSPLPKEEMPQPFWDLAKQAGGSSITGKELTRTMLIELRGICNELLDRSH
jgi:hypothetical protein